MGKDGTTGKIFSRQNFRDLNHPNRTYGSKYIGVLRIAIRRSPEEKKLDRPILTGLGRKRISPERRFPRRETEKRQGASTYPDRWGPVHRSTPPLFFLSSFFSFFSRLLPSPPYHPHAEKQQRGGARRRRRLGARERSPSTEAGPPEHTAPVGGHGVAGE